MSKATTVISLSIFIAGLGIGYIVGDNNATDTSNYGKAAASNSLVSSGEENDTTLENRENVGGTNQPNSTKKPKYTKKLSTQQIIDEMKKAMGDGGNMMNIRGLFDAWAVIENLPEARLTSLLSEVSPKNFRDRSSMGLFMLVASRLAELNPEGTMELMQEGGSMTKSMGQMMVLDTWAKSDPSGAYKWYKQQKSDDNLGGGRFGGASQMLTQIFQGLASENLDMAVDEYSKLDSKEASRALRGIASELKTKEEFLSIMNNISDDQSGDRDTLLTSWLQTDTDTAGDWYYEDAEDKKAAVRKIVEGMVGYGGDLEAATDWLLKEDRGDIDDQWSTLIQRGTYMDPKAASELLANIQDDKKRDDALINLVTNWKHHDKKAAENFIKEADISEETRKKLQNLNDTSSHMDSFGGVIREQQ